MIERLTGSSAESARRVARETGISQETLSRWLRDARFGVFGEESLGFEEEVVEVPLQLKCSSGWYYWPKTCVLGLNLAALAAPLGVGSAPRDSRRS